MEFRATLVNEMSGPGAEATATMIALKASILAADAALKAFNGATSAAATGLAGASSSAVKASTVSVDRYGEALSRMRGRIDAAKGALANTAPARAAADAFDHLKDKATTLKDSVAAGLSSALGPLSKRLGAAKDKAGELLTKVKDTKGFKLMADVGTLAGGALSKGLSTAKDKAGAFVDRVKDSKAYSAAKEGLSKIGSGLASVASGAGKAGVALSVIAVGAAAAGVKMGLPLALGYKGMAKLQMISAKLGLDVRKLFSGVDASPVIRAAEKFAANFSKTTSTGRVLSDIVGRIFNGLFGFLEAAQPYITAFAQGMMYGFLVVENAVLKVRIAAVPFLGNLNSMVTTGQLMKVAFYGGAVVMGLLAVAALAAAAPFIALGVAIEKVIGLWNEYSGNTTTLKKAPKASGGALPSGPDAAKTAAPSPAATGLSGQMAGSAMAAGLVKGIVAGLPAAGAAGALLAKAADTGVRTEAEIKSPSRKMRRNAGYMTAGAVLGFKDGAQSVQDAAANALVPDLGKASPSGPGKAPAGAGGDGLTINFNGPVGGPIADFEAAVRRVMVGEIRDARDGDGREGDDVMSNPIEDPGLYNYITLDGTRSPGLALLESGGERSQKWENQQAPGFAGAITIFKGEEIAEVSYSFVLWTIEHFKAWDDFATTLRAGTKKRPPRVYELSDPAVSHNEIKAVSVANIGPLKKLAPSKWGVVVKFTEYRKPKASGGPIKPAQNEQEKQNEALNNENKALEKELAAKQADYAKENH